MGALVGSRFSPLGLRAYSVANYLIWLLRFRDCGFMGMFSTGDFIMTTVYANAPQTINEKRASVLIGDMEPTGKFTSGDRVVTQYKTEFGLVTVDCDTWGEDARYYLLRFASEA